MTWAPDSLLYPDREQPRPFCLYDVKELMSRAMLREDRSSFRDLRAEPKPRVSPVHHAYIEKTIHAYTSVKRHQTTPIRTLTGAMPGPDRHGKAASYQEQKHVGRRSRPI